MTRRRRVMGSGEPVLPSPAPTESLDEFPRALLGQEVMPWDDVPEPIIWEWGQDRGRALTDLPSANLVFKREWLAARNQGNYWSPLIAAIDTVLTERGFDAVLRERGGE